METVILSLEALQSRLDAKIEDIEDVRLAMEALQKYREAETDLGLKIPPIEEAFFVVTKHNIPATTEELEEAESLSYLFRKLRYSANNLSGNVDRLHPTFQKQLHSSLTTFRHECTGFCASYAEEGPMVTGLIPREASDKLAFFQVSCLSTFAHSPLAADDLTHDNLYSRTDSMPFGDETLN